jgi:hypothetical protein
VRYVSVSKSIETLKPHPRNAGDGAAEPGAETPKAERSVLERVEMPVDAHTGLAPAELVAVRRDSNVKRRAPLAGGCLLLSLFCFVFVIL